MPIRLYIPEPFAISQPINLSTKQVHYLYHVMRLKEGDHILVFNSRDGEWQGTLGKSNKKSGQLYLQKQTKPLVFGPDVRLLFAPIKSGRIDYLVEKATELGVSHLYPVLTERTVVRKVNHTRLEVHIIEAAEQSERITLPKLYNLQPLTKLLDKWDPTHPLIVGDERGKSKSIYHSLHTIIQEKQKNNTPISFLIGPEGGFSNEEFLLFDYYNWITPVSLGDTVLRTDTAALMALSTWRAVTEKESS